MIGNRVSARLKELNISMPDLAKRTGIPMATVYRIVNGEIKSPRSENLPALAKALNVSIDWLVTGKESKAHVPPQTLSNEDTITIPLYDVEASMGTGITPPSFLKLIRNITVEKDFFVINNIKYTSFENLVMVTGIGDSMLPTFNSGDPIIVDLGIPLFKEDGIYFFTLYNDLYVKRLQKLPNCLKMISDNTLYTPFDIKGEDLNSVIFHGKALFAWHGRRV